MARRGGEGRRGEERRGEGRKGEERRGEERREPLWLVPQYSSLPSAAIVWVVYHTIPLCKAFHYWDGVNSTCYLSRHGILLWVPQNRIWDRVTMHLLSIQWTVTVRNSLVCCGTTLALSTPSGVWVVGGIWWGTVPSRIRCSNSAWSLEESTKWSSL